MSWNDWLTFIKISMAFHDDITEILRQGMTLRRRTIDLPLKFCYRCSVSCAVYIISVIFYIFLHVWIKWIISKGIFATDDLGVCSFPCFPPPLSVIALSYSYSWRFLYPLCFEFLLWAWGHLKLASSFRSLVVSLANSLIVFLSILSCLTHLKHFHEGYSWWKGDLTGGSLGLRDSWEVLDIKFIGLHHVLFLLDHNWDRSFCACLQLVLLRKAGGNWCLCAVTFIYRLEWIKG